MEKLGQAHRKVRFMLPDSKREDVNRRDHGTMSYVNGTLITQRSKLLTKIITPTPVSYQILPKVSQVSHPKPRSTMIMSSPVVDFRSNINTIVVPVKNQIFRTIVIPPQTTKVYTENIEELKARHIVVINTPPAKPVGPKMEETMAICDRFSRFRLIEDMLARKRKNLRLSAQAEIRKPQPIEAKSSPQVVNVKGIAENLFSAEHSTGLCTDLLQRWNRFRYREAFKLKAVSDETARRKDPLETVSFRDRIKADVRRFGCYKMSLERDPAVTTLLRAARDADEQLLKIVLKNILIDGISKEALNSTDKSGRTAISYICSSNLTTFLDVLLQIPGIDVNKPDNEGNTPLHFAAQAGQVEALNMLLTRCKTLQIDAKNCLGFTPLMKAALQGRTRCAKLLLFAGASPTETDSGRQLKAEDWAKFCGRESCATMLEKCTKARMLDKTNSCRNNTNSPRVTLVRSKTNPCHSQISESFRSTFKKFMPFGLSAKDRQNKGTVQKKDFVNFLKTNSSVRGTAPRVDSPLLTTILRPLEVPK